MIPRSDVSSFSQKNISSHKVNRKSLKQPPPTDVPVPSWAQHGEKSVRFCLFWFLNNTCYYSNSDKRAFATALQIMRVDIPRLSSYAGHVLLQQAGDERNELPCLHYNAYVILTHVHLKIAI